MTSVYRRNFSHLVQILTLILERGATVALATLLLRIHLKMARMKNIGGLRKWVKQDTEYTIITLIALVLAFILSLVDEIILWIEDND